MGLFGRKPPRRRGLFSWQLLVDGKASHDVQCEVEALEQRGSKVRIRLLRMTGTTHEYAARKLVPAWIEENAVRWFPEDGA
jgi:hypothetical protein